MNYYRPRQQRKIIIPLTIVIVLLGLIFLPGPNGLISVLLKLHRINRYRAKIRHLRIKSDSLKAEIKLWQNPASATTEAQQLFNQNKLDTLR